MTINRRIASLATCDMLTPVTCPFSSRIAITSGSKYRLFWRLIDMMPLGCLIFVRRKQPY